MKIRCRIIFQNIICVFYISLPYLKNGSFLQYIDFWSVMCLKGGSKRTKSPKNWYPMSNTICSSAFGVEVSNHQGSNQIKTRSREHGFFCAPKKKRRKRISSWLRSLVSRIHCHLPGVTEIGPARTSVRHSPRHVPFFFSASLLLIRK